MKQLPLTIGILAWVLAALPLCRTQTAFHAITVDHIKVDAEGEVSDVTCSGVEMRLKITARNGTFRLHARDYTRVDISEDVPFQAGEFKPCTELEGKTAKITFVTVERKSYDGEIQSIEVESSEKR